jgi:hypothetical protein
MTQIVRAITGTGVAIIFSVAAVGNIEAATKEAAQPTTTSQTADMIGTVTINEGDTCMIGIKYWLHPAGEAAVRLKPTSRHDYLVLEQAAKKKSLVHVNGTWEQATECRFVKTTRIQPAKS